MKHRNLKHPCVTGYATQFAKKQAAQIQQSHSNDIQIKGKDNIEDELYNLWRGRKEKVPSILIYTKRKGRGSFKKETRDYYFPDGNVYRLTLPRYAHIY